MQKILYLVIFLIGTIFTKNSALAHGHLCVPCNENTVRSVQEKMDAAAQDTILKLLLIDRDLTACDPKNVSKHQADFSTAHCAYDPVGAYHEAYILKCLGAKIKIKYAWGCDPDNFKRDKIKIKY